MARQILNEAHVHPAIRDLISGHHLDTITEVQKAIAEHRVVVVGMAGNPVVTKAKDALREQKVDYSYLGYGSYFGQWRRRNSLKMWTGWPTFPMVFVDGMLVGGHKDLQALIDSGELKRALSNVRDMRP